MKKNKFKNYKEYIDYQIKRSKKTKNMTIKRELRREFVYERMVELGIEKGSILCIGARDDSEVVFFEKKGLESEGIDLYKTDKIIKCDMSRMLRHSYLKDKKYDIIYASEVLEHCLDIEGLIKGLNQICKGYFICMGPSSKKIDSRSKWDCSIHDFMKEFENEESLKKSLENTFTEFKVIVGEIYKKGGKIFFIMEKK